MKPRITMGLTADGEFEIWLNELGRDLLVKKLQGLKNTSDRFHLGAFEGAEVEMEDKPYRPTDTIIYAAKYSFVPMNRINVNRPTFSANIT